MAVVVAGAGAEGDQVPAAAVAAAEGDAVAAQGQEHHQVCQGEDRGGAGADEQSESVSESVSGHMSNELVRDGGGTIQMVKVTSCF